MRRRSKRRYDLINKLIHNIDESYSNEEKTIITKKANALVRDIDDTLNKAIALRSVIDILPESFLDREDELKEYADNAFTMDALRSIKIIINKTLVPLMECFPNIEFTYNDEPFRIDWEDKDTETCGTINFCYRVIEMYGGTTDADVDLDDFYFSEYDDDVDVFAYAYIRRFIRRVIQDRPFVDSYFREKAEYEKCNEDPIDNIDFDDIDDFEGDDDDDF
jgi:hypothetical protein